ncbi:MAG: EAL domain-containing protein [Burkholderiaceae bacterium]
MIAAFRSAPRACVGALLGWVKKSLGARILVVFLGLLLVVPIASFWAISIDDALRLPHFMPVALIGITLLGIGAFALGSVFTTRRVSKPLRTLTDAADRFGAGDYATPIPGPQHEDELGLLAQSFERMRVNVADKQQQILQLAHWDSLTGLPNRVQFRDAVQQAIAQAEAAVAADASARPSVAVLMLDLDRFKHVNDVLGYRFGDLLLKRVAERLSHHNVRGDDIVARLGGDEFAVLLRHGDAALAASVAQRITRAFETPLTLEEHSVDMGAGIGMACWPKHAAGADALLSRAEVAMYAAKRSSDGPLLYHAAIDAASAQTLSLLTELRNAIDRNELRLYLQPKLMLETGRVGGAETLVRWLHPQRGLVAPVEFIPFAEQTGFIRSLTMWVFEEAARHWLRLHAEGLPLVLSVNLSSRDLLDQDLPQKFDALLVKHRVPAEAICLEITERAIMSDPQRALATLSRLSGLGFKLSIDDFGTGYSSLAYLKHLPVDELKIDKSFVLGMETDLDDAKIVRSIIDLAHNMGLTVVAEGVESATVWNLLRELECDEAQGYHMGKPMPANEFQAWSIGWADKQRPRSAGGARAVLH